MRRMTIRSLAAAALLLATATGAVPTAQDAAPPSPAVEQISFIYYYQCGYVYSDPPCQSPVLADLDGSHMIGMPTGEWSPDGRLLLVTLDGDIFLTSATGGTRLNLTNSAAAEYTPRWSPDGARIAFASNRDGAADLYVMNADGSNVVRLNTGAGNPAAPTWSPDSTRVAFSCVVDAADLSAQDICAINADGSAFVRLTSGPGYRSGPDWSPDGSRILFTHATADMSNLEVVTPSGGNLTIINEGSLSDSARWSPDGSRIAFISFFWSFPDDGATIASRFVTVMNADGTGIVDLGWGEKPVWRPFAGGVNNRPSAAYTFGCDGPTCTLDASGSTDPDGTIAEYGWQFSDGTIAAGPTVTHTFTNYQKSVQLTVMDDDGALSAVSQVVNLPPVAAFTATCVERTCTFDGSASSDPDGNLALMLWTFGDGESGYLNPDTYTYAADGTYVVTLTVTDESSGTNTASRSVVVRAAAPPPAEVHVGDMRAASATQPKTWTAYARVFAHDAAHGEALDIAVTGQWSDGTSGSCSARTASYCDVSHPNIAKKQASITFTVTNVAWGTATYAAAKNHDPGGDSTGTTLNVIRP
jgi:dipeptidyl aminopeptidase/acylaminoacyl peptidase